MIFAAFLTSTVASAQEARPLSNGQTLYLPIYKASHVLLSALGSIRNTDGKRPIRILSAKYFDTNGKLLAERVPTPLLVAPFGTVELFVELNDASGGSGANFVVKWEAEHSVNPPLVESLHANMDGGKAVIFMTQSVPLAE